MPAASIRTAELRDLPVIGDVFRRASLSNDGDRSVLLANPAALEFEDAPVRERRTRVAVERDHVVGFATISMVAGIAELDDLFVAPESMRRGIGRALVADAASTARSLGARRLEVTGNPHASSFYEATGFVVDGSRATEFGSGARMHLDLPD